MSSLRNILSPYRGLRREVYVIFISRIINAMGCFVMPLVTIILTQRVGLSRETTGFYISLSGFLFVPAAMLGGKLTDSFGRKRVIAFFDGLAVLLYVLAGIQGPSLNMVYTIMCAGAAMTAAGPAHDSLIADLTLPAQRSAGYALSYMGWNMGFALGPVLGGILYQNHLPWVFYGDALTALIGLILILTFIPETYVPGQRTNFAEQMLSKNSAVQAQEGAEAQDEVGENLWERGRTGSIFTILRERPVLIYFALIIFGYNFAYSQWSFMLPMQAMEKYAADGARYFGLIAGFNGLVVMLFTPLLTRLTETLPSIRRSVFGGILYAWGFGMLGVLNTLPFFFLSAFIFTLGEILLAISVTPFISEHTPSSHRGRMNAALPMIFGLGNTLGPLGMGKLLQFMTIESGWIAIGLSTLVFSVLMLGLDRYDSRHRAWVFSAQRNS